MKFTKLVILAACAAPASSFVNPQHKIRTAFKPLHAIEDLEAKLLDDKPSKKAAAAAEKKSKPAASSSAAKPATAGKAASEKLELPKYESFTSPTPEAAPKKVAEKPPKPAPKPKPVPPPRPQPVATPRPAPVPKPAPAPRPVAIKKPPAPPAVKKVSLPKPPKAPAKADPNAVPLGLALGAVPLLLAPVALLGAGRSALAGTVQRREQIQTEIQKKEEAARKKTLQAEVDGSALTGAVVRLSCRSCCLVSRGMLYRVWGHCQKSR
jgi:hypothetical protein